MQSAGLRDRLSQRPAIIAAVPSSSVDNIRDRAQDLLNALAGPTARLRDDQAHAIEALVSDRRRVLVVQRTGWGKSAVYFLAAKLLREQGSGPAILISPLLALMRNQIEAASRMGLAAATINSSNQDEWPDVQSRIASNEIDLLAISPERLNNMNFVEDVLPALSERAGLFVIDEAHCISQWGHDFRPDYMRIRDALERVSPDTPVLATTATATDLVVTDVASQLSAEPVTLRGTLDRQSLELSVVQLPTAAERLAWLAEKIPSYEGSGIVYCLTQAAAEQLADWLKHRGIAAKAYSGATDAETRQELETALIENRLRVLAATSALGMGFDKPDLAFAINLGAPSSITSYYQMAGRAGRALDSADGVLVPAAEDARIWDWFEQTSFPPKLLAETVLGTLNQDAPMTEANIEARVDIRRGRLQVLLKVLDIEGAVKRVKGGWIRTASEWAYDQERYDRVRAARRLDRQQVLDYQQTAECRMKFLRAALDDPEIEPDWSCGRCDNCTSKVVTAPSSETIAAAETFTRTSDVVLPARKMWPAAGTKGMSRIKKERQALDGRALAEFGTPGWNEVIASFLESKSATVSREMLAACAAVLKRTGWPAGRPTWVTYVPSVRNPMAAPSLARALGEIGKMPVIESLRRTAERPPQLEMSNSAHACKNVVGAFELCIEPTDVPQGPVLVIDDAWQSGWTMTVVVDLIRDVIDEPVYPFVLQKR